MKKIMVTMGVTAGIVVIAAILSKAPFHMSISEKTAGHWTGKGILESVGLQIDVDIQIDENHIVHGEIGAARFENGVIKSPIINVGDDSEAFPGHVIETVILNGKIAEGDDGEDRMINIFFSREEDRLKGYVETEGLFVYPEVIVDEIILVRQE